ncbi:hypothetical protein [Kamptonema formosum]|uniref:hypothetical protein n=1 Tax=Kamptonema formosum TaxID=331992 RepID=UPI00035D1D89|nr:hypothetical protein [Oscillatoria sp. PCC 10802]
MLSVLSGNNLAPAVAIGHTAVREEAVIKNDTVAPFGQNKAQMPAKQVRVKLLSRLAHP